MYKGSAPRVAHAALYARARKFATEICKGSRKKRPMICCDKGIDNAKSLCRAINSCPMLCAVLCACWRCHIRIGSAGVDLRGGGGEIATERRQSTLKKAKRRVQKHVYTGTWYLLLHTIYLVLLCVRKKAQHSMKQHRTAGQGTAPHGATLL